MSIAKYNRTPSLFKMFFDDPFTKDMFMNFKEPADMVMTPKANIRETDEAFVIDLAIPGSKKDNINIELDNNLLKIKSSYSESKTEENEKMHLKEFSKRTYERSFSVPDSIEFSAIKADYQDGILTLVLPKNEQSKTQPVRQIKVD